MTTPAQDSRFRWTPSGELIRSSNLGRFMARHGIESYDQLVRQAADDPEWFWHGINVALRIEWFQPYKRVMDDSGGNAWTKWFVNGKLNVAHNCVDRHVKAGRGDHPAVLWEGEDGLFRRWTYSDLAAETNQLAGALVKLGVQPGDRVGIFLPMMPEAVAAFMAIAKIGAVSIPIFSGFGPKAVAERLADAEAKVVLTADGFLRKGKTVPMKDTLDEALLFCPSVKNVIVFDRMGLNVAMHPRRDLDWVETLAEEPAERDCLAVDSEHPLFIGYTSGTTGRPKGAVHVHGGFLVKIAEEVTYQTDMTPEDTLYWFTDLGWIMGPWEIVGGLSVGGSIFLYEGAPDYPGPDRLWAQIEKHRVTILGASPTLIRAMMKYGTAPVRAHDLSSLRILGSTGEPWNPEPWLWYFENVGGGRCPIINFTGGTEVGACFLSTSIATPLKPCSLGRPSLGMATDVFDPEGKSMTASGGVGELVCTKPWPGMTRGLWNAPDRFIETYWSRWPEVWVHGDWASVDADGDWFLHGRSDDTLKISGKRIGPSEVESALVGHPDVIEAAAVGLPHELKGETVCALVVLREGAERGGRLEAELRERVTEALGKSFLPERLIITSELPKTRSGKVMRRAVRAVLLGTDPGDLSTLENPSALEKLNATVANLEAN